jgi:hypothetical protein
MKISNKKNRQLFFITFLKNNTLTFDKSEGQFYTVTGSFGRRKTAILTRVRVVISICFDTLIV